jgi:hypothetical protein
LRPGNPASGHARSFQANRLAALAVKIMDDRGIESLKILEIA